MQGDVAAVVDVGPQKFCRGRHRGHDFFRDCAGYGSHWSDEGLCTIRRNRRYHTVRNVADGLRTSGSRRLPQKCELAAQFIEDRDEAQRRCAVGERYFISCSEGLDDQVDGTIVKMQATVG
jgi:hypothetical protein